MRLLFDHNLAAQLVRSLGDIFPGSEHTGAAGLARAQDEDVWSYAREHGLTVITKDSDFHHLSLLRGAPPKVIWIRIGNCSTTQIERLLREERDTIAAFLSSQRESILALG